MTWTVLSVVMLIASLFAGVEEIATSNIEAHLGLSRNDFLANYIEIEKALRTCAVPSENMFIRPVNNGQQQGSEFDQFCYYEARDRPLALYLCQYYKFLVETYFGQYCNDPNRQPMDTATPYQLMRGTPFAPCKELVDTVIQEVQHGVNKPVFSSTDECETLCHQSLFCTNLAYLLSIFQMKADIQQRDVPMEDSYTNDMADYFEWEAANSDQEDKAESGELIPHVYPREHPCWNVYCENGGTCVEKYTSVKEQRVANCSCREGFRGNLCQFVDHSQDPCWNLYCENGGTCVEKSTSHKEQRVANCSCREGFHGNLCQFETHHGWNTDNSNSMSHWHEEMEHLEEEEENGSHFFVFLVVSIILIIFMYIVYHNKTKIKEYFGDLQAERKTKNNARKVNYNVYIRLEERT